MGDDHEPAGALPLLEGGQDMTGRRTDLSERLRLRLGEGEVGQLGQAQHGEVMGRVGRVVRALRCGDPADAVEGFLVATERLELFR